MILLTKGTEITIFGQLKILMMFSINLNLKKSKLNLLWHSLDFSLTFFFSKLSTYDFSTLYTTLPHHLIKDKLIDLINRTFIRENNQYLACNERCAFFTSDVYNNHNLWSCQKVCDALVYLLDNILLDLELNFIGKLLVFRWELMVLFLLKICFFFVMREIS